MTRRAKLHVVDSGIVIQDNAERWGGTGWRGPDALSEYKKHAGTDYLQIASVISIGASLSVGLI